MQAFTNRIQFGHSRRWIGVMTLLLFGSHVNAELGHECLITPNQVVDVRSATDGLISDVLVKRGDTIRKGQLLVALDSSVQKSAVAMAKHRFEMVGRLESSRTRLEFANKKLERVRELEAKDVLSEQQIDEAIAEKSVAEAELLDAVELQKLSKHEYIHAQNILSQKNLLSPFDGVVVARNLNPGDLAEAGSGAEAVLRIAKIDPLLVEVALPIDMYGLVVVGDNASISPEGDLGKQTARVAVVDRVFDAASGTFGVQLELANESGLVPAGIRCQVFFGDHSNSISKTVR